MRLDVKRQLFARSERVKGIDFHPTEPWILTTLYSGHVYIWSFETQAIIKTFELTDVPVRAGRFVSRKNWIVCGSDDFQLRVYNYNTSEKITSFEAHPDYIRAIVVHPTLPFVLTASDDMTIKLWDWDKGWKCVQVFEGHSHYVMGLAINPKDTNTFASACLDRTVKVWNLGSGTSNFTLEAHETKGVNHVDYYPQSDKPYLLTTSDDRTVKIWDYTTKALIATLEGHTSNVSFACYHPELPVIISGSEDGTVKIWHANTYRLEQSLSYGLERAWCVAYQRGKQGVAMGFDDGAVVVKMGREEPAVSMDGSGKIIWARHSEILTSVIKGGAAEKSEIKDGQPISLPSKDLGSTEIYPQTLIHSPNGRFVAVCGDGEYIIYTALALRNQAFGSALDFAWAGKEHDRDYAIRESQYSVKIFRNFKPKAGDGSVNVVGDAALAAWDLGLAEECFEHANDLGSLFLLYSASADAEGLRSLAGKAKEAGVHNVVFTCLWQVGDVEGCLGVLVETGRLAEAVLFAQTYVPSRCRGLVGKWKDGLERGGRAKVGRGLGMPPGEGEDGDAEMFPEWDEYLGLEKEGGDADLIDVGDGEGEEANDGGEVEEGEEVEEETDDVPVAGARASAKATQAEEEPDPEADAPAE
ncbi:Coatomer subunit beta' [Friedmanniomyces endolithicus]|uniref:Beta'-coat protein n=1 Tax=Rachicladosporium monterosium TaxID=1507873 RepID=A0ABR0L5E5_9PEZI|nr:Coatomer subunit beta' [Friedmanniomyces endolithicus]KAK5143787.1 Coatomer subunit beta' [Rachicladosporium monterosium]